MSDDANPYTTSDPGAVFALLDVLTEAQVRQLADLLHQIKRASGYGEVCVPMKGGDVRIMSVKVSMDTKKT